MNPTSAPTTIPTSLSPTSTSASNFSTTRSTSSSSSYVTPSIAPTVSVIPGGGDKCGSGIETIPDSRPACAINNYGNTSHAFYDMYACCQGQPVNSYGHDDNSRCYVYCLAQDQTLQSLRDCISHRNSQFFLCNGNGSSSGNDSTVPTSEAGSPSVVMHTKISKAGIGMLVILAVGSAAGMLL